MCHTCNKTRLQVTRARKKLILWYDTSFVAWEGNVPPCINSFRTSPGGGSVPPKTVSPSAPIFCSQVAFVHMRTLYWAYDQDMASFSRRESITCTLIKVPRERYTILFAFCDGCEGLIVLDPFVGSALDARSFQHFQARLPTTRCLQSTARARACWGRWWSCFVWAPSFLNAE